MFKLLTPEISSFSVGRGGARNEPKKTPTPTNTNTKNTNISASVQIRLLITGWFLRPLQCNENLRFSFNHRQNALCTIKETIIVKDNEIF